jgi:methionine-rich copper-binding protein CopC
MFRLGSLSLSVALGMVLVVATPALAHNVVEERIPEPDSTVTESPVAISITSNDTYLDLSGAGQGFGIVVRDTQGLYYGDGCVVVEERTLQASASLGEAGTYEITYQFISADGHSLSNSYEFTFAPSESHLPAQGLASPPECGVLPEDAVSFEPQEAVTLEEPLPIAQTYEPAEEPQSPVLIAGFLALVAISVVGWVLWRARVKRNSTSL